MKKKFYITTAIDYVNAPPHLGHALEKIQADVIARYQRTRKREVFFLTGTDENSLKNVQAAEKERISVKELVDKNARKFQELKETLNLSFDDFIRTTQERHKIGAKKFWFAIKKDIYKKKYRGLYCLGCEAFYTPEELKDGLCPEHKRKPEVVEEENYFFRLSKYQKKLEKIIESEKIKIIPETRKNEVLSFIKKGLEDICVSRSAERAHGWGIEVAGDKSQIIWVWVDALSNYLTGIGYGTDERKFQKYWPADVHVIGKGISRFHCVFWPAFLLSANLPLPKTILVHGYITVGGQKISKSLGNVIDPFDLVKKYGTDAVRYFLLREISPFEDGDFTFEKFEKRYNADLARGLGNLVLRITTLSKKANFQSLTFKVQNSRLKEEIKRAEKNWKKALDQFKINDGLKSVWNLISFCDHYIDREKPWELLKNQRSKVKRETVINNLLFSLKSIAKLLGPFLPETSEKIFEQIKTKKHSPLFQKIEGLSLPCP